MRYAAQMSEFESTDGVPTLAFTRWFVERMHRGQTDKAGNPYVNHVEAVGARLQEHGEWAVMAGLLHDAVEDTEVTLGMLRALGYPDVVVGAVDAVTRRDSEAYDELIERAAKHPLGCLVKLADNAENQDPDRLALLSDKARDWFERKYARARAVLLAALDNGDVDAHGSFGPPAVRLRG